MNIGRHPPIQCGELASFETPSEVPRVGSETVAKEAF